jgi:hypothetical protein
MKLLRLAETQIPEGSFIIRKSRFRQTAAPVICCFLAFASFIWGWFGGTKGDSFEIPPLALYWCGGFSLLFASITFEMCLHAWKSSNWIFACTDSGFI